MRLARLLTGKRPHRRPPRHFKIRSPRSGRHKVLFEPLEPRLLLSADTLVSGLTSALETGLLTSGDKLFSPVISDEAFNTPIPGVLQTTHDVNDTAHDDGTANGKLDEFDVHVPIVWDTLSLNVNRNGDLDDDGNEIITPITIVPVDKTDARDVYEYVTGQKEIFGFPITPSDEQALNAMDFDNDHIVDAQEIYRVLVVGAVEEYLAEYNSFGKTLSDLQNDFAAFLSGLGTPAVLSSLDQPPGGLTPASINIDLIDVTNEGDADHFSYAFTMNLTVKDQYLLDLGLEADKNEIIFPATTFTAGSPSTDPGIADVPVNPRMVELAGSISLPFRFTLDIPIVADNFRFAVPDPMTVSVEDAVAGFGGESLQNLIANVGFLGTQVPGPAGDSKFDLKMDWSITVTDSSSPSNLGFTQSLPTTSTSGVLTAATALPNDPGTPYVFPGDANPATQDLDVIFSLKFGEQMNPPPVTVTVTAESTQDNSDAEDLRVDVQTALTTAGLGSLVTASLTGADELQLSLPAGLDVTPLGYGSNQQYDGGGTLDATGAPTGAIALGSTSTATVKFLLSVGGALPTLIEVMTTPEDDDFDGDSTLGDLDMAGLIADINAALPGGVTASDNGGNVRLSAGSSLEVTRTIELDAKNEITVAEFNHPSFFDEFVVPAQDTSDDALTIVMPLDVRQGLDYGPTGNPGIRVDIEPFNYTDGSLEPDASDVKRLPLPLMNLDGPAVAIDNEVDGSNFVQYLDFNVVGPGEAIGMIQQLETWLTKLRTTDMLGKFNIPFAQAVLGNLLAFEDMIHDTLLTEDNDTDDTADDTGRLLAKITAIDPDAFVASFGTAQELGARLYALFDPRILTKPTSDNDGQADPTVDFAAYDKTAKQLTYQISLSHLLAADNVGTDFASNVDLSPIGAISTQSKIHLEATGHFDAILGIQLGPGKISETTPLDDLNGGLGVDIETGIAFTGAEDVRTVEGRLSADALFSLSINGGAPVEVRVYKSEGPAAFNGATAPDVGTDAITISGHGLKTGDAVVYNNGGGGNTSIGNLTSGTTYFVIRVDSSHVKLATTAANALAVTPVAINLTAAGTGAGHTLLHPHNTDNNTTTQHLINDINNALVTAGVGTQIQAEEVLGRIVLKAIGGAGVNSFSVTTSTGDTSYTQLGLPTTVATTVFFEVEPENVKVSSDVVLNIFKNGEGTSTDITLRSGATGVAATEGNTTLTDLVNDINEALANQGPGGTPTDLYGKVVAARNGTKLVIVGIDGSIESLRVSSGSAAAGEIGLGTAQVAGVFLVAPNDLGTPLTLPNNTINVFGKLTADAHFSIALNADPAVPVTVFKSATDNNTSLDNFPDTVKPDELLDDINAAIAATGLAGKVEAFQAGNLRIGFRAVDDEVKSFTVTAALGDPAVTELGLAMSQTADAKLRVGAIKNAPSFFGPASDATFQVTVVGGTSAVVNLVVTLHTSETLTDYTIQDLVGDVRRALDTAFNTAFSGLDKNPLLVSNDGNRILLKPKSTGAGAGVTAFSITANVSNPAVTDLKLYQAGASLAGPDVTSSADTADLLIYTQDGAVHRITLDSDATIGDVLTDIDPDGLGAGPIDAAINSTATGLTLNDRTPAAPAPTPLLRVDSVNDSHAAQALGIFGADTDVNHPDIDNQIDGTRIATLQLADRFFLRQVNSSTDILSADVTVGAATFNGSSGSVVTGNQIKIMEHGFASGDAVVYNSNGADAAVTGLTNGTTYYVINVDRDTVKLASSKEDALAGTALAISAAGTGTTHRLQSLLLLEASFGFVGVKLTGSGAASGTLGIGLSNEYNDSDDALSLADLLDALSKDQDPDGSGGPLLPDGDVDVFDLNKFVDFPSLTLTGDLVFTAEVYPSLGVVGLGTTPTVTFHLNGPGNPFLLKATAGDDARYDLADLVASDLADPDFADTLPDVDVTYSDLASLENFIDIDFGNILTALQGLSDFLNQFAAFSFLNAEIPFLGVSFNELVDIADRFEAAVTEIVQNPAGALQKLEQKIRETFGLPAGSSVFALSLDDNDDGDGVATDMLKVKLNLSKAFSEALMVDLDLSDQLPGISLMGSAGLNASGSLTAVLTFGVDLDDPTDLFLFTHEDETSITADLAASADNLTFNAALGPVGIFITGGDVDFTLTGGFKKPGGAMGDKMRLSDLLSNLGAAGFAPTFEGGVEAVLPVFFPTQSNFRGDIEFEAELSLVSVGDDYDLDFTTDLEVPPDLLNIDFSQFNLFDSIILAVDTFDAFLAGIQDLLDGEIFGIELPLIGDKLSEGAEFINDLRKNVIQPFREFVETAQEQGTTIIQNFLFDVLGPGDGGSIEGLGLLLDPTELDAAGNPTPATSEDRIKIDQIIKKQENLSGPISQTFVQWNFLVGQVYTPPLDFDFDLGFPGLSLDLEGNLIFSLGWKLGLGLGVSIQDGPYIEVTRSNSTDDPTSHLVANVSDGSKTTFENISPNNSDLDAHGTPNGAAGGRVNGLASVAGTNQVFYVASEYGGIYKSADGGDTWMHLDGHLPTVTWDVEVDPVTTTRVYATSFYDGRTNSIAGINVSTDGGTTWTHPASAAPNTSGGGSDNTPQGTYSVDAARVSEPSAYGISIRPDEPQHVAIGTNAGVAVSHDSGATWQFYDPTPGNPAEDVYDVQYQADSMAFPNGIIDVVGPFGHARSTDGGATWTAPHLLPGGVGAISIAASPDEHYVLFAVSTSNGLYESDDAGVSWNLLGSDTSPQGRIPFVTINDRSGMAFDIWYGDTNLFRIPATSAAAPGGPIRAFAGTLPTFSTDGVTNDSDATVDEANEWWLQNAANVGAPFQSNAGAHADVGDVVFDRTVAVDAVPKLHSNDGGVYRNTANSQTPNWEQPSVTPHGLFIMGFAGVHQPGIDDEDLYFVLQDDGVWALQKAGAATPAQLSTADGGWHNNASADAFDIAADDDRVLFNNGVFGEGRRERAFLGPRGLPGFETTPQLGNYPTGAVIDFKHSEAYDTWGDDKFAMLTANNNVFNDSGFGDGGLFITTDIKAGTIQWIPVNDAAEPDSTQFADLQVALDGSGNPTFYVTVGSGTSFTADQLWKVTGILADGTGAGSATWTRIDTNITGAQGVSIFAADPANPLRLYAAAVMAGNTPLIWRSNDGGASWEHDTALDGLMVNPDGTGGNDFQYRNQRGPADFPFDANGFTANQGLTGYPQPTLLAFDPEDSNIIVAGGADSGLFLSTNAGNSWALLTDPLGTDPNKPHIPRPRFAHFDHEGGVTTVFIASQGGGIWRIKLDVPTQSSVVADPEESPTANNDKDHATNLVGAEPSLTDKTIHNGTDVDYYKYAATQTGNVIVNLYFDNLFGNLDLVVKNSSDSIIDTGRQGNVAVHIDLERVIFPVVQGEDYYIVVSGASGATGFYDLVVQKSVPELDLFIEAGIGTGSTLTGTLAFLQLDVTASDSNFDGINTDGPLGNGADPTRLRADFTVDIFNGDNPADNRLSLFELGSVDAVVGITAEAEVNLDLKLGLNEDLLPDTISAALPTVRSKFLLDWSVGGPLTGDLNLGDGLKLIEFRDVGLDLGSFLGDTVGPIVAKIQEITGPLQPIIDIVTARIPVLSDLAGRTITLVDIAAAFGEFDPGLIYAVADIISLVNSINVGAGQSLFLELGDFKIVDTEHPDQALIGGNGGLLTNPNFNFSDDSLGGDFSNIIDSIRDASGQLALDDLTDLGNGVLDSLLGGDSGAPAATTTKSMFSGGFSSTPDDSGFAFPIFEKPSQIFGLLLGRNATIITYDLPPFLMDFKWEVSFPIYPPLYGVVTAGIGMKIDLAFGYDTEGIMQFAEGGFQNPLDLIAGFFISDTNMPDGSFGVDVPELVFTGTIGVGAELNLGIASAGVTADIILTVNFDLYDPDHDGKVRIDELVSTFLFEARNGNPALAPIAIFDVYGNIAFQLSAFIKFLVAKIEFNITPPIVLFEFSIPFDREPILATERGDGSVLLNIGPNAGDRHNGDTRDIAETIKVKDGGSGKVAVWSEQFGVSESAAQLYSIGAGKPVVAFGGEENDVIDLHLLTSNPAQLEGGSGNDIINGGAGADIIKGDIGDDELYGNAGDDIMYGGEGNDAIDGGEHNDTIFGDTGSINSNGAIRSPIGTKDGNDTITGGLGADIIFGDGGDDMIGGDVAYSSLDGGGADDNDYIFGDGASIEASGGAPDFTMVTNPDGTVTFGTNVTQPDASVKFIPVSLTDRPGGGKDTIRGHGGLDVIFGGSGNDDIDGGTEDDTIYGESGLDLISGGGDADTIMGGTEDDRIFGFRDEGYPGDASDGMDTIFGEAGNDFIRGNEKDDYIEGNAGADIIFGDYGNDEIFGNNEPDLIFGGPDRDTIDAGTGNDIVFGDDGFVVWVNFFDPDIDDATDTPDDHRAIGLISGDADVFDNKWNPALTDAQLDFLDADIRLDADAKVKTLDLIKTLVNSTDGNDRITGGEGDDIVLGGADALFDGVKGDTIFGDFDPGDVPGTPPAGPAGDIPAGEDILIGDGGRIQFDDRRRDNVRTLPGTLMAEVGNDTISGNGGRDLIFGGGAADTLYGRIAAAYTNDALDEAASVSDDDVIIGDDGTIQYETLGLPEPEPFEPAPGEEVEKEEAKSSLAGARAVFVFIRTEQLDANALATGGMDHAYGNKGEDIIFGGVAGDVLKGDDGADGDDIIFGDNGQIDFGLDDDGFTTKIEQIYTTDTLETTGGPDTIEGQDDDDIIFGGVNNGGLDSLYGDRATPIDALDAQDIILGDNGKIRFDVDPDLDTLDSIESYLDALGGADAISGNRGDDVLIGSTGGDTMYGDDATASAAANDGEDIMLGDNGNVVLIGSVGRLIVRGTAVDLITTTDTLETTGGADTMSGNAKADIMLGGVNNGGQDTMYGDRSAPNATTIANDGDDVLLGDNGLLDFTHLADTDRHTLDLISSFEDGHGGVDVISGNKGLDVAIGGTNGDTIYGDDAGATATSNDLADILLGDNADIFLVAQGGAVGGDLKLVLGSAVFLIRTTDEEYDPGVPANNTGGVDTISGNAKGDIIAGGVEGDTLYGDLQSPNGTNANDGNDIILGDNGAFEWLSTGRLSEIVGIDINANNSDLYAKYNPAVADTDLTTLDLITTEQPNNGGRDKVYGDNGRDVILGGTDVDTLYGDTGSETDLIQSANGNDLMFGDHGRLYPQFPRFMQPGGTFTPADFPSRNFFAIDIDDTDGGEGDRMWGEEGDDVMLGQQGDDRMWGGSGDDDMIGGHNVSGGYDELTTPAIVATLNPPMNDIMDGGSGDDAMAGDNAIIWRRGDENSPRFRQLAAGKTSIYSTDSDEIITNVETFANPFDGRSDPDDAVGRDITLVDHSDGVQLIPLGRFGADVMAGGADSDVMFGELGNDLMQGDGNIGANDNNAASITRTLSVTDSGNNPDTDETLYFNIPEAATDADDYMEGNGGHDLMYGGLGQDDMIGGSSALFGLSTEEMRPDGSDTIFGGAGIDIARNHIGDATEDVTTHVITTVPTGHSRDADFIMGDNANVLRLVDLPLLDAFLQFNYDKTSTFENRGTVRIIPRAMQQLDYTLGGADFAGGTYVNGARQPTMGPADNGAFDLIHGESGDDYIFGMTGSDIIFGEGQDDDIIGGYGHDWISGGTGQDGVLGDDGLLLTSRNSTVGEPLYGIAGLFLNAQDPHPKYSDGNVLDEVISTPGQIQTAVINKTGDLKKTVDLVPFSYDPTWLALDDEFPDNQDDTPFADDIIFGGLGSDFLHSGSGDDAISGAEALLQAFVPVYNTNGDPIGLLDLGYNAFTLPNPINPGDLLALNPNPGDVLAFNPVDVDGQHPNNRFRAGEFRLYDEYSPRHKILLNNDGSLWDPGTLAPPPTNQFLLNFDKTEGVVRPAGTVPKATGQQTESYPQVNDDGADAIFGDLGNDWIVGGTGRDDMYGGWGNDLLQADDNHETETTGVAAPFDNESPDTHPTYEDRAYGGAGRDVLLANTGGDRLIDWVGEYNTYLVPFAPFGEATVSRTLQPFLPEFLYALSAGDGADPTRYRDAIGGPPPLPTNNDPNPSRNGEPHGELGLVLQKDFAWQDQTGPPADPQAGNIPGGHRDVLRSANFNDGQAQGFAVDVGTWSVVGGRYQVAPTVAGGDAVSVYYVDSYVPRYFEMLATINAVKPTGGAKANAYVVFDYQSPTDFKFAGINISTNKLEIGHRNGTGWIVDKQAPYTTSLKSDTDYNVFLAVNGSAVTLVVNNQVTLNHTFAPRVDSSGLPHAIHEGMVGLGANNAKAKIDNVAVQRVPPIMTLNQTLDFSQSSTLLQPPLSGTWSLANGRYIGTAGPTTPALDLFALSVGANSVIELTSTFMTTGEGGFVFDRYAVDDFKFVTISTVTKQILLGHRTSKGWFIDGTPYNNASLVAGTNHSLGLTLKGTTVSVTLNGATVLSRIYNAVVTDGGFGLFSRSGQTSYDVVTVKSDDQAFSSTTSGGALTALTAPLVAEESAMVLTAEALPSLVAQAEIIWANALGGEESGVADVFETVTFAIADLPGLTLGQVVGSTVFLDVDAAGNGWFIDVTPAENTEFRVSRDIDEFWATPASPAFGRMDLLTVVLHELGHVLGLDHLDLTVDGRDLMSSTLATGVRHLPDVEETVPTAPVGEQAATADAIPMLVFDAAYGTFQPQLNAPASVATNGVLLDVGAFNTSSTHRKAGRWSHGQDNAGLIDWDTALRAQAVSSGIFHNSADDWRDTPPGSHGQGTGLFQQARRKRGAGRLASLVQSVLSWGQNK